MKPMRPLFASAVLALAAGALQAQTVEQNVPPFIGTLSGSQEIPSVASPGTGDVTIAYNSDAHTLHFDVTFANLTTPTTAAHVHCCTPGTAPPATTVPSLAGFPLGVTSGTYDFTLDLTQASSFNPAFIALADGTVAGAEDFLIDGLLSGVGYFNIHTTAFPGGEIRANLTPIPEPDTYVLLGAGLLVGWLARRRLRR